VREEIESKLFHRDLTLFNQTLDVVFIDTTSLYCYRDSKTDWRKRGYSRDHRPDLPQFVLCVAVNVQGWPIAWEIFPGNTADHQALRQVVTVLRQRFSIRQVTVVADRGMISRETLTLLTEDDQVPIDYVLGCRMRLQKEVSEAVLARAGRYQHVAANLEVRPLYHHRDDTCIGHIVVSFLALRLEADLQQQLDEREVKVSWPDLMRDLGQVHTVLLELDGKRHQLRTDMIGSAHHAFAAAGVRPPSPVTPLGAI
jgi:transposase